MTGQYLTRHLDTHDITISSHLSSLKILGNTISQLPGEDPGSTSIHLNFAVKERQDEPCMLAGAEELELIIDSKDAERIGHTLNCSRNEKPSSFGIVSS